MGYAPFFPGMTQPPGFAPVQPMMPEAPQPTHQSAGPGPQYQPQPNPYDARINRMFEEALASGGQQRRGGGMLGALMAYASPGGARAAAMMQGNRDAEWNRRINMLNLMLKMREFNQPQIPNIQTYEAPGSEDKYGVYWDPNTGQFTVPQIAGAENLPVPQPKYDDVRQYVQRYEATPQYQKYVEALPIYQSMYETQGDDDRAADLNYVYGLAKIMDPTSVVREGEQWAVRDTASLPDWLTGEMARLNGGGALRPETRAKILKQAYSRLSGMQEAAKFTYDRYARQGERYGFPVEDIATQFPTLPKPVLPPNLPPKEELNVGSNKQEAGAAPSQSTIPTVKTPEEAAKLAPGTVFKDANGKLRQVPK